MYSDWAYKPCHCRFYTFTLVHTVVEAWLIFLQSFVYLVHSKRRRGVHRASEGYGCIERGRRSIEQEVWGIGEIDGE
jgi:hypothetical protein